MVSRGLFRLFQLQAVGCVESMQQLLWGCTCRERSPDCWGLGFPLPQGIAILLSVCVRTQLHASGLAALLSPSAPLLSIFYLNSHVICFNILIPVSPLLRLRLGIQGETLTFSSLQSEFCFSLHFYLCLCRGETG